MDKWKEIYDHLNKYLHLATFPVGIKLLKSITEFKNFNYLKQPEEKIALCQIFSYSRYYGWTMGCTKEDNLCPLANIALGFEEPYDLFKEGAFFIGRYNKTKEAAKRTTASMPVIKDQKYSAIISAALHRVDFDPDIILIWGNSAQIMRLIQGKLWEEGGRFSLSTFCDGVCADIISEVYNKKKMQVAFPCLGDRRFGLAKDSDLVASIPKEEIEPILNGIEMTHKAGTRYPIPYELSTPKFFVKLKKQLDHIKKKS
ncbi:MAG: hypothetical protein EU547_02675 [Promethearchaeota archaeon]|nr:MAG: hypothetical protein EU547_02675 [Candidatus Lokiarchaeota archaeon]